MNHSFFKRTTKFSITPLLFFLIIFSAQAQFKGAYEMEANGYFTHPVETGFGIVATDNYASKLYLISENTIEELVATPGCGRYFTVSPDKNLIGFKQIRKNGLQVPAIYDIKNRTIKELCSPVKRCGQVSFSHNGKIAFTIDTKLYVLSETGSQSYELGTYSNITPISPDGSSVAFDVNQKKINILNLKTGKIKSVTKRSNGSLFPQWSPDGSKLLFSKPSGELMVWKAKDDKLFSVGKGLSASWSDDSQNILCQNQVIRDFMLISSDIYQVRWDGSETKNLTNTPTVFEMTPAYASGRRILFHTYNNKQIVEAQLNRSGNQIRNAKNIHTYNQVAIKHFTTRNFIHQKNRNNEVVLEKEIPYVHQVYDVPSWSNGYAACAPTTSVMAFAYFNRLPEWPVEVDHGQTWDPHVNSFGSYVTDKYYFNGYYFDAFSSYRNCYGGYGHMWITHSSPSQGGMASYHQLHDVEPGTIDYSTQFDETVNEIDAGFPHAICNYLTSSGHLNLAIGYNADMHYLILKDPYGDKNTPGYPSYDGEIVRYDWAGYNNGYQNLGGSHGFVPWTHLARTQEPEYDNLVIDDEYYGHGFYMNNSENGAKMRYYRDDDEAGYNNHYWWTYATDAAEDVCWVSWTADIPLTTSYELLVYITDKATSEQAKYVITHAKGEDEVIINQSNYSGEWVSLGTFQFTAGKNGSVRLGDNTGEASSENKILVFDALKWVQVPGALAVTKTNVTCKGANDGTATATIETGNSPYSFEWNTQPVQTTATASGLAAGEYIITVTDADENTYTCPVFIKEADQAMSITIDKQNPTIIDYNDGKIETAVSGGVEPYQYDWENDISSTAIADSLLADTYSLAVSDSYGCTHSFSVELVNPAISRPHSISLVERTLSTASLTWDEVETAGKYLILLKTKDANEWNEFESTETGFVFSDLQAMTDYEVKVAAIADADTSAYAEMVFMTNRTTACRGTFTDTGGRYGNYDNDELYNFTIEAENAGQIKVNFVFFETEPDYDFMYVYDGKNQNADLIGTYHGEPGDGSLPGEITSSGNSITFSFSSDYATTETGWVAYWSSIGGTCETQAPETTIEPVNEAKSDDFTVTFTDTDANNVGLKEQFYMVEGFNGEEWTSNPANGFISDSFDNESLEGWTAIDGDWDGQNGYLHQSNQGRSRANVRHALNQENDKTYLYKWRMKIHGTSSNIRAGIHIFNNDTNNCYYESSYYIEFRQARSEIRISKYASSVETVQIVEDFYMPRAKWFDCAVMYSPESGEINVFYNGILAATYTDPEPLTQGTCFYMRTGSSAVYFDDIQVYQSRDNTGIITVGNEDSNDIQFANPDSESPTCQIHSLVVDNYQIISDEAVLQVDIEGLEKADITAFENNDIQIYAHGCSVFIQLNDIKTEEAKIDMYNLSGQCILSTTTSKASTKIDMGKLSQIIIVKVTNGENSWVRKVWTNKK